ncbi:SDR family NAD(P)-dependent oxidoreductase [Pedobacter frigoris]|uniref:SDR family oxidoreductase n=1 Tax=Pedobacter frigoris TaxID=2571272 RepID=A0A4U1CNY2_9SPHI|nr:SDR family oxidoreductase [Pedobacter frigoris]TKC08530.1 SDR family oxidoreductase [Pedobacter frigoris]
MQLLENQVIFLTGGSMGIGLECAKAYARAGASVVIAASSGDPEVVAATLGEQHLGILCDVSNAAQVAKAISRTLIKYGKINAIHNNAGIASPSKPLHETSDEEWDQLMNVNLKSVLYTSRFGFEALKKSKGCILNTSSLVGEIGQENHAAYTATKGGMNALTKSMALDYAPHHIRVNAVLPAGVWTPLLKQWNEEQADPQSMEKYLDDIHPLGYCPKGDVIADACVFLISDKARFITGTILPVSGGAELGYKAAK